MESLYICKLRTLNDGGEDLVQYRKRKKALLSTRHFVFIGEIIITLWPPWVVWKLFFLI